MQKKEEEEPKKTHHFESWVVIGDSLTLKYSPRYELKMTNLFHHNHLLT